MISSNSVSSVAQLWDLPVYHLNHPAQHLLTLGCPGAQANMAVAWDRGSKPIYRSKHLMGGDASSHRLYLDAGHHLVFNPATVQDSGTNLPSTYSGGSGWSSTKPPEDQQHLIPLLDKVLGLIGVLCPLCSPAACEGSKLHQVFAFYVPYWRCSCPGVYTCWLQGRPAAQVYLLVYAHLGHGQSVTSHREFPSALRSTLKSYTVMTAVFCFLVLSRAVVRFLRDAREEHVD